MNCVERLTSVHEVLSHWSFFIEGMAALNDPAGAKAQYTPELFLQILIKILLLGDKGFIIVLKSKNGKNLAFGVACVMQDMVGEECLFVAEVYSNGKCKEAITELRDWGEREARRLGIRTMKACTRRLNGAAIRLFQKVWGFEREYVFFRRDL